MAQEYDAILRTSCFESSLIDDVIVTWLTIMRKPQQWFKFLRSGEHSAYTREDEVREHGPLPIIVFEKYNFSYAAIFREAADWPVVWRNEILNMRGIGNENLK